VFSVGAPVAPKDGADTAVSGGDLAAAKNEAGFAAYFLLPPPQRLDDEIELGNQADDAPLGLSG